jgi:hypothetical protein
MEMKNYWIYILLISITVFSCKKAEDRSCLKFAGDESTKIITLGDTDSLYLFDNIEYTIVPDTIDFIELKGGENLLNHIECMYYNDKLEVRNKNKCNFLRSYKKKVKAFIHVQEIRYIHFEGTESLISQDTLKSGELRLLIRDGAGPVELTVENGYMSAVVSHGWGDFTLHGNTSFAFLNCSTNSFCNTSDLKVESDLKVYSNTAGNMTVNANGTNLHASIKRDGNILYTGVPNSIEVVNTGEGEVTGVD